MREEMVEHVNFYSSVVGLGRDIVLIVIVLLTVAITLLGGDPTSLNASDWALLVTAALLAVIAPVVCFLVFKAIFRFIDKYISFPLAPCLPGVPLPRGFIAWYWITVSKIFGKKRSFAAKREYVNLFRWSEDRLKRFSESHKLIWRFIQLGRLISRLESLKNRASPYLFAILALSAFGWVFWTVLSRYAQ